jgi:hypothetical protein
MAVGELTLEAGQLLLSEGEPSERVALLLEGEVEVFRTLGGQEVVLGVVGAGDVVGEMGVLEGRRRAASVRARTRVRVRFLGRDEFIARVARDPVLARELLLRLSDRLRRANDRPSLLAAGRSDTRVAPVPPIRLLPEGREPARWLPPEGLPLRRLPFTVGRRPLPGEHGPGGEVDLTLPDVRPLRLSRRHFAITADADGIYLVDKDSRLGTIVDDVPLGEAFPRTRLRLAPGSHLVIAGGLRSPWRFRIDIGIGA